METPRPVWRPQLLARLEGAMGRPMLESDLACIAWNDVAGTLTVECIPLLAELRARNVISNVFRSQSFKP